MEDNESAAQSNILQAISMNTVTDALPKKKLSKANSIPCLICTERFIKTESGVKNPLLAHLLSAHKVVIGDVDKIAYFPKYVEYWRERFTTTKDLTEYCVVVNTNTKEEDLGPKEKYFLLTNYLPEDLEIRQKLSNEKLVNILDQQHLERQDSKFSKKCLFCKVMFHGNRSKLFQHMAKDHAFNVGNPDNIVHAGDFIDMMKSKLDKFTCLFCEKEFKEWSILKDHMRKKGHKRLDPKNKEYDKYYVINYLEPGKDWKALQTEPEYEKEAEIPVAEENMEKEWEDWIEDDPTLSLCLFCMKTDKDVYKILDHMKGEHKFDLKDVKLKLELDFYHQVKIVNYVRKQVYQCRCPMCLREYDGQDELQYHLADENHFGLPDDRSVWDQPGYFFSTFDDDSLLCFLEDEDDDEEEYDEEENYVEDENQNITKSPKPYSHET